ADRHRLDTAAGQSVADEAAIRLDTHEDKRPGERSLDEWRLDGDNVMRRRDAGDLHPLSLRHHASSPAISSAGSIGSLISRPSFADRSMAMVSTRLRCPSAAVACGVGLPE